MDQTILRIYHLSRQNMLKTARYRGYDVSSNHDMTLEDFVTKYKDYSLKDMKVDISNLVCEGTGKTGMPSCNSLILTWHSDKKMGNSIRDVHNEMEECQVKRAIVVVDQGITASCKGIIGDLKKTKNFIIDIWTLEETVLFVPEHVLVPKHRVCTFSEKKNLMKRYPKAGFPTIKSDAIMVKYLGAKKGNIIEIIRPSETDPESDILSYRIVG